MAFNGVHQMARLNQPSNQHPWLLVVRMGDGLFEAYRPIKSQWLAARLPDELTRLEMCPNHTLSTFDEDGFLWVLLVFILNIGLSIFSLFSSF